MFAIDDKEQMTIVLKHVELKVIVLKHVVLPKHVVLEYPTY